MLRNCKVFFDDIPVRKHENKRCFNAVSVIVQRVYVYVVLFTCCRDLYTLLLLYRHGLLRSFLREVSAVGKTITHMTMTF